MRVSLSCRSSHPGKAALPIRAGARRVVKAASRTKGTYLSSQYARLARRLVHQLEGLGFEVQLRKRAAA
jgi:hypothetical protein